MVRHTFKGSCFNPRDQLEPVAKSVRENLQVFYEIPDRIGLMTEFRPRKFTQRW